VLFTIMAAKGKAAMNTNVESNVSYFALWFFYEYV